jgi:hypothetical protein
MFVKAVETAKDCRQVRSITRALQNTISSFSKFLEKLMKCSFPANNDCPFVFD